MKKSIISCFAFLMTFGLCLGTVHAVSNVRYDWGFNKSKNEEPADAGPKYNAIVEKYGAIYKADASKKDIYLTFDNGYENGYTEKVLDTLKEHKVPAAFFVTGHYLKTAEPLVKRMVKEGHIIGNHSWNHPDFTQVSDEKLKEELDTVKEKKAELSLCLSSFRRIGRQNKQEIPHEKAKNWPAHTIKSVAFCRGGKV